VVKERRRRDASDLVSCLRYVIIARASPSSSSRFPTPLWVGPRRGWPRGRSVVSVARCGAWVVGLLGVLGLRRAVASFDAADGERCSVSYASRSGRGVGRNRSSSFREHRFAAAAGGAPLRPWQGHGRDALLCPFANPSLKGPANSVRAAGPHRAWRNVDPPTPPSFAYWSFVKLAAISQSSTLSVALLATKPDARPAVSRSSTTSRNDRCSVDRWKGASVAAEFPVDRPFRTASLAPYLSNPTPTAHLRLRVGPRLSRDRSASAATSPLPSEAAAVLAPREFLKSFDAGSDYGAHAPYTENPHRCIARVVSLRRRSDSRNACTRAASDTQYA